VHWSFMKADRKSLDKILYRDSRPIVTLLTAASYHSTPVLDTVSLMSGLFSLQYSGPP
jgi:hypothetical protein